jgi:hypothetical protein
LFGEKMFENGVLRRGEEMINNKMNKIAYWVIM